MIKNLIKLVGSKLKKIARSGKRTKITDLPKQTKSPSKSEIKGDLGKKAVAQNQAKQPLPTGTSKTKGPSSPRPPKKKKPRWDPASFAVVPVTDKSRFHDFDLPSPIMHAIADLKFEYCTPIQGKALPETLKGRDLIGRAQTGTGKSAAFLISMFARMLDNQPPQKRSPGEPRALIIAPTRELVIQIMKDARGLIKYTNLRALPVFGGVDYQKQKDELQEKPVDLLVATPGRLLDFLGKRAVSLHKIEVLVLDEADRMLDMGFIPDVRRIVGQSADKSKRQTMMFSATITEEVKHLASQWCKNPYTVEIEPEQVTVDTIEQIVYLTTSTEKYAVLYNLLTKQKLNRVMVFTNRKDETRKLTERLKRNGINCAMLSGDVDQKQRTSRLENFREGKINVLVATDVAGRGIHIEGISHVVNYTLPYEPEDYVHRIGRTGRAGKEGISISFACDEGAFYLPEIEEYIGRKLECVSPEESLLTPPPKGSAPVKPKYKKKAPGHHRRQGQKPHYKKKPGGYKGQPSRPD